MERFDPRPSPLAARPASGWAAGGARGPRAVWLRALSLLGVVVALVVPQASRALVSAGEKEQDFFVSPAPFFRQAGLIVGDGEIPFVADLAFFRGPGDSTRCVLAVSLANDDLQFLQKEEGFEARCEVMLTLLDQGQGGPVEGEFGGIIRARTFPETNLPTQSVLIQGEVRALPGRYEAEVMLRDLNATTRGRARRSLEVPGYSTHLPAITFPTFLHFAAAASAAPADSAAGIVPASSPMDIVINPRRIYRFEEPQIQYLVEIYSASEVRSLEGWHLRAEIVGSDGTRGLTSVNDLDDQLPDQTVIITFRPDSLPLGIYRLETTLEDPSGARVAQSSSLFMVTWSEEWMASNFEELVDYLEYIATPTERAALKRLSPGERLSGWLHFWGPRDPVFATPVNELLVEYFRRLDYANRHFSTKIRPGWRTDRGRVYVHLGTPDELLRRPFEANTWPYEIWVYYGLDLTLVFQDRFGFEDYQLLTPYAFQLGLQRVK